MKTVAEVFATALSGDLWAGNLIPNYPQHNGKLENRTPIDNTIIGYIARGTPTDVDAAVSAAKRAVTTGIWSNMPPTERRQIMLRWAKLIEENAKELAALDCIDAGKPIDECLNTDLPATIETFYFYAEYIDKAFGRTAPTGTDATAWIVREPVGIVGVVLPWNFPAQMFAWKVVPALAAGNAVIVKPAELTSLSAYRMVQLAHEAGIPPEALTLVCGLGEETGKALGLHPQVDMVAFTGSTEVGRLFLEYSAQSNLKEIVLECGGKSPQIVFADADLDEAVPHILAAAFWNMGENCSCGSRLIVESSVKDRLLDKLKNHLANWKLGDPRQSGIHLGPMVELAHFEKVMRFIETSKQEGAHLFTGGTVHRDLGSGWYIEPTIFDNVTPSMTLFQEEVFGPVLAVTTFETETQAVELANASDYGLAASLYTQNLKRAHSLVRKIRAGTVSVNGFSEGNIATPFGGYKHSGFGGRDKGVEAFDQYTQQKTVWFVE